MDGSNSRDRPHPPSTRELARIAGVSNATVSYALRNDSRISKSVRERIRKLAEEMGYECSETVRQVMQASRQKKISGYRETLGLVTSTGLRLKAPGSEELTEVGLLQESIREFAGSIGCAVDLLHLDEMTPGRMRSVCHARGIRRVLLIGAAWPADQSNSVLIEELRQSLIVVVAGYCASRDHGAHVVLYDFFEMGREAVHRAWMAGCRRILFDPFTRIFDREGRFEAGILASGKTLGPFIEIEELPTAYGPEHLARLGTRDCLTGIFAKSTALNIRERLKEPSAPSVIRLSDFREERVGWSGFDKQWPLIGRMAVKLCMGLHEDEEFTRGSHERTLINVRPQWTPGVSLDESRGPCKSMLPLPGEGFPRRKGRQQHPLELSAILDRRAVPGHSLLPPLDLAAPFPGRTTVSGVRFSIAQSKGATRFAAFGQAPVFDRQPGAAALRIPVGHPVHCLYLLHGCAFVEAGRPLATYRLVRTDGETHEVPLIPLGMPNTTGDPPVAANIQDWYPGVPRLSHDAAREVRIPCLDDVPQPLGYLNILRISAPWPSETIDRLEIDIPAKEPGLLFLFAVSLES